MPSVPAIDPRAVRRQFNRRAHRIARADFLLAEIEQRMLERLDWVRIEPALIIDVGCGAGRGLAALAQRFDKARCVGVDAAHAMLVQARARRDTSAKTSRETARRALARFLPGLARSGSQSNPPSIQWMCADAAALPLAANSVDLLWSSLAWHWFDKPQVVVGEWYRVMRPEGLLMFSSFGVDTWAELRALGARLPAFPDLHDVGDLLSQSGFADPVMDSERITLSWSDPAALLADLAALGGNPLTGRRPGLATPAIRARWLQAIESLRQADGLIRLSVEVVYAHAWMPARKRLPEGYAPVQWHRPTAR
jgi:malonyl-CoA O-methyltransferase